MYGHKFTSQFGEQPTETWVTCLKGVSGPQMANGLRECLERCLEWPPAAAEFRNMALGRSVAKDGTEINHGGLAYKWFDRKTALTNGTRSDRKSRAAKECKSILGMLDE